MFDHAINLYLFIFCRSFVLLYKYCKIFSKEALIKKYNLTNFIILKKQRYA